MKCCIVGAGAIGVYLGTTLAGAGHDVTVVARGKTAARLRESGMALTTQAGNVQTVRPRIVDSAAPGEAAGQDAVFITVKGYSVPELAPALEALSGAEMIFIQNGLPWWYLRGTGDDTLDPGGKLAAAVPASRIIGCVTYANVRNTGPGTAQHMGDDSFVLGRPDGSSDPALEKIAEAMAAAGLSARVSRSLARDIWIKLWGSVAFNPISALTGATLDLIAGSDETGPTVRRIMGEVETIAAAMGVEFGISIEERLAQAAKAGAFRTSMLQDLDAGRRMEIDAIIGSVAALARRNGVAIPATETLLALIRQKARIQGLD
jgi:2-dehydropantoate 2-reductase